MPTLTATLSSLLLASLPPAAAGLPSGVIELLGGYQVATPHDYVTSLQAYAAAHPGEDALAGVHAADLDGDGRLDYAVLAVEPRTRAFRFMVAIARPDGRYTLVLNQGYRGAFEKYGGFVYALMGYKPAGQSAWTQGLYAPRDAARLKSFVAAPALALSRSVGLDPYNRPDDYDASSLLYCRDVYYYAQGQLAQWLSCQ